MKREIVYRELKDLTYTDVQRTSVDARRAAKMAKTFDPAAAGTLVTSRHDDGVVVVLDGMHRTTAGMAAGFGEEAFPCYEFVGLSRAEEARLFLEYNDTRQVQPIDKFRVRVIAEDRAAVRINEILVRHGWQAKMGGKDTYFNAIAALEGVYRGAGLARGKDRPDLVAQVLSVITEAWGHETQGAHGFIVGGLGQLYARYGDRVDTVKLISELQKTRPLTLVGRANQLKFAQGGLTAAAMAKVLVDLHNKRRRTHLLPEWHWTR